MVDPLDHYTNIGARLVELRGKLQARQGKTAFDFGARKPGEPKPGGDNISALKAEIDRLEKLQATHDPATRIYDL